MWGIAPMPMLCQLACASSERGHPMSTCVFIQLRCKPGTTYQVAEEVALREIHSELYSTSGDYDLLMKVYIPEGADVGKYINDSLLDIPGIERSLTTLTFKAF
jgi:DNA-binding Lrp family transcriptional regulator